MPEIELFVRGNKIIARATWKTESVAGSKNYDTLSDPTTVTFTARKRGAAATAYVYLTASEVTRVSLGIFELAFVPAAGHWWVHAQGTGTAQGAGRVTFEIDESEALAA